MSSILEQHSNPAVSNGFSVYEGDFFVGRFTLESAPNAFLRRLMIEANEYGDAEGIDSEGCKVTVLADEG